MLADRGFHKALNQILKSQNTTAKVSWTVGPRSRLEMYQTSLQQMGY